MPNWRFDSLSPQAAKFFDTELEHVRKEVVADSVPECSAQLIFPQDTSIPSWKETYSHKMYEMVGIADFLSDHADDLPLVDVVARKETFNLRRFGCAYRYTEEEIEASMATGMRLDRIRAETSRQVTEEKHNAVQFFGDPVEQLFGWANYPNVPRTLLPHRIEAGVDPDDILTMLNDTITYIFSRTKKHAKKFVVRLPTKAYGHMNSRRLGDTTTTLLKFWLESNNMIEEVTAVPELDGAGPMGEDLILIYPLDMKVGSSKTSEVYKQHAPQPDNLAYKVNCTGKTGGAAIDKYIEMEIAELPLAS